MFNQNCDVIDKLNNASRVYVRVVVTTYYIEGNHIDGLKTLYAHLWNTTLFDVSNATYYL